MKNIGNALLVIVGLILIAGFGIQGSSSIPDNAKVVIFPEKKEWIPAHSEAADEYERIIGIELERMEAYQATWSDVTSEGEFSEYELNDEIRNMGPTSWVSSKHKPLILHLIFGPKERWDSEGNWLY